MTIIKQVNIGGFGTHVLPPTYQEVEYVQGTGTQYIRTGISTSDTKGVYLKLSSQDVISDLVYFGSKASGDSRFRMGNKAYDGTSKMYMGWNTNDVSGAISKDTIYEIKVNYLNDRKKRLDDTVIASNLGTLSSSNTLELPLFAGNDQGTVQYASKIKLYSCKISNGNSIIADLIPCYRKFDNTIGLYDVVNGVFYTNSGSGTFLKGADVGILPKEYQQVEYIQSSGTQYFNIGTEFKTSYKSVIDFQMDVIGGDYVPLGVRDGGGFRYGIDVWNSKITAISGGSDWKNTISEDTNRHTITINTSSAIVDGSSYGIYYSSHTFSGGIGVFAYNRIGSDPDPRTNASAKIYKLDIYDDNWNHIYNLIPCYRKSDGEIGLYDCIGGEFYTNEGTGNFAKGEDSGVVPKKSTYKTVFPLDLKIPEGGLLGYWPLQSDLKDLSGNRNDGTWYGTGGFATANGKTGARVTRNTSNYNSTQHIITPVVYDGKVITVAGWVNYDSNSMTNNTWTGFTSNSDFANHDGVSYTYSHIGLRGPDSYKVYCAACGENTQASGTPSSGTRYCYMMTSDGETLKFYVNGVLVKTATNYGGIDTTGGYRWRFGKWAGLVGTIGYIRHCAIYNRVLSDNEALAFYNATV